MALFTGKASDFLRIAVAAAGRGDMDAVGAVLAERPRWIARIGSHGRTMLWEAAYRGRAETVEYLLDRGADTGGESPLASALRSTIGKRERIRQVVRMLADAGPDPDRKDKRGHAPRHIAARKRDAALWLDAMACAPDAPRARS